MAREIIIDMDAIFDWLRDHANGDHAPSRTLYDAEHGDLPGFSSLQRRGWTWNRLIAAAGLLPPEKGRPPVRPGAQFLRANPGMAPASVDEEVEQMRLRAEPPVPDSWPLFGIPTKVETFIGRFRDGTPVRCTRHYFSLR